MKRSFRCITRALAGLLTAGMALSAVAASAPDQSSDPDYPTRPIRLVVPFSPGGASDFVARLIQPKMSEELGQRVVIDNRSGAAGNIGVDIVARAAPDGYTLLLGNIGTMAINPSIFPNFPFKPVRDLVGITLVADIPGAMGVHPSIPVTNVKEFLEYAKARPGQLNYGSSGGASSQRLSFEVFMKETGIKLVHIPYKDGAGASTLALVAGEVATAQATVASYVTHAKNGRIRIIAVIAPKRIALLPDVPTMAEQGFPDWVLGSWLGVHAPAGTPQPIVNKLYATLIKTMNDPWVIERFQAGGAAIVTSKSPQDYAKFMQTQNDLWGRTVKEIGITAE